MKIVEQYPYIIYIPYAIFELSKKFFWLWKIYYTTLEFLRGMSKFDKSWLNAKQNSPFYKEGYIPRYIYKYKIGIYIIY